MADLSSRLENFIDKTRYAGDSLRFSRMTGDDLCEAAKDNEMAYDVFVNRYVPKDESGLLNRYVSTHCDSHNFKSYYEGMLCLYNADRAKKKSIFDRVVTFASLDEKKNYWEAVGACLDYPAYKPNCPELYEEIKNAAESDDPHAAYFLAKSMIEAWMGFDARESSKGIRFLKEVFVLLKKAAALGFLKAKVFHGCLTMELLVLLDGGSKGKYIEDAILSLRDAAETGDPAAQESLAELIWHHWRDMPMFDGDKRKAFDKVLTLYLNSACQGYDDGQYGLGNFLLSEGDVFDECRKSYADIIHEAKYFVEQAAIQDHVEAYVLLGKIAQFHADRFKDYAGKDQSFRLNKALEYYQKAVDLKDEDGLFCLGNLVLKYAKELNGYSEDPIASGRRAVRWISEAAEKGHEEALLFMSNVKSNLKENESKDDRGGSDLVKKLTSLDPKEAQFDGAYHCFLSAADQGHSGSMFNLGMLIEDNKNNEKNLKKIGYDVGVSALKGALEWYEKAAQGNYEGANVAVKRVKKEIKAIEKKQMKKQSQGHKSKEKSNEAAKVRSAQEKAQGIILMLIDAKLKDGKEKAGEIIDFIKKQCSDKNLEDKFRDDQLRKVEKYFRKKDKEQRRQEQAKMERSKRESRVAEATVPTEEREKEKEPVTTTVTISSNQSPADEAAYQEFQSALLEKGLDLGQLMAMTSRQSLSRRSVRASRGGKRASVAESPRQRPVSLKRTPSMYQIRQEDRQNPSLGKSSLFDENIKKIENKDRKTHNGIWGDIDTLKAGWPAELPGHLNYKPLDNELKGVYQIYAGTAASHRVLFMEIQPGELVLLNVYEKKGDKMPNKVREKTAKVFAMYNSNSLG